jgi:hypothetical protein
MDDELKKYLESLTDKKVSKSDNQIIAYASISENKTWLENKAKAQKGKKYSEESRAKMSVSQTGKTHTKETRAKLSAVWLGRKHSEESRAKMRLSRVGIPGHGKANKPIVSVEYGVFAGKKYLAEHMTSIGVKNADNKLTLWLKTKPTEFYYITKEEYTKREL